MGCKEWFVLSRGCLPVAVVTDRAEAKAFIPGPLTWSEQKKMDRFLQGDGPFPLTFTAGLNKRGQVEPDYVITKVNYGVEEAQAGQETESGDSNGR